MDYIIAFSIKQRVWISVFLVLWIIWGFYGLSQLPIDAVPDITNNQVQIITKSPAYSAEEIEKFITAPLELALANVQNVEEFRSISRFGLSVITVVFEEHININLARQWVSEKLSQVNIPVEMGKPELMPISTGLGEIYQYVLKPKKGFEKDFDAMQLRTLQDWHVRRLLAGTKGVVEVNSFGGFLKEYEISINPEKLRSQNLTILDILHAIPTQNENTGGSYLEKNGQSFFIRAEGRIKSLEEIKKIIIKNQENTPILVENVANVQFGHSVRYGAMTQNGNGEVVGGIVMMLKGENSSQVIERVKEKMQEIQKSLPKGVEIQPFLDRSALVGRAINTVINNLLEGSLIVILGLVFFLGNIRAGLIVASVIPLSLLFAFGMMYVTGVSANLMSLGALDFGLVVDGAVIMVEAILHQLSKPPIPQRGSNSDLADIPPLGVRGLDIDEIVYEASTKIRFSASFGELIILLVYLPILALSGIEGKMFRPMAQTVSFAIIGAFILSLTYVPMMSAFILKIPKIPKLSFADKMMLFLQKKYLYFLKIALRKYIFFLISTFALATFAVIWFLNMGGEFMPQLDEGDFAVETRLANGTSLSQTIETSTQAEKILIKFPEVLQVVSKIGTSEIPTDPMPMEANDLMIVLKDKSLWKRDISKEQLAEEMQHALEKKIIGANFEFQQPIQMRFNELIGGVKSDIAIKIFGEDLETLQQNANKSIPIIQKIKGVQNVKVENITGLPQVSITYNRNQIARYNISIKEINTIIRAFCAGEIVGDIFEGEKRFNIVVRGEKNLKENIEIIKNLGVPTLSGEILPLSELATIEINDVPAQVSRENTQRRIVIGVNVQNRDLLSVVNDIKIALNTKLKLPDGYYFKYGGQFETLQKAQERLLIAVPVALAMILLLLYITFNSWKLTFLIFSAIPLSAIGGIFALGMRAMTFSISAGVGFIALFGVAVLNGIVLISYFQQLKTEGYTRHISQIIRGTKDRLRPVLMTATVASIGFLPMALSHGAGAEVQKPLATVVIGGLISSTLLTLFILPIFYLILFPKKLNK
jgi:heavy metal efflux system protein